MRVLLIESSPGAGQSAATALDRAGHEVLTCFESSSAFPCKGVEATGCPLDTGVIDVALLVREAPDREPTPFEAGARCAIRRQVPLAVTGTTNGNPYQAYAALTAEGDHDVVTTIERAHRVGLMPVADAARAALIRLLEREEIETSNLDVGVERSGSTLTITLRPGVALDPALAETASVRALAAVRGLDTQAAIIDVAVESPAAAPA